MGDSARKIENLLYTYAERIDDGNLEGVADLFRHGRIKSGPDAPPETTFEGRDRVLGLYRSATRIYEDGTPRTRHVTTNAIIEVDEQAGRASARSYYTVFQKTDDAPLQPIICGHYHDTFQRIEGQWWFDTRTMFIDLVGDLSRHLLFELR
jgi:3-phenylpropionate/cinnamic acid dioxygenase small subunit